MVARFCYWLALAACCTGGTTWLCPSVAHAQACCAGSGAYLPVRLQLHEAGLVAVVARAGSAIGNLNSAGTYFSEPAGDAEVDLQQDLAAVVRVLRRGQVGLKLPVVETYRAAPPLRDFGGGVGDLSLLVRYDFVYAGQSAHLPGLALTAVVTAPSGRPPEQAHSPLLTDATGTGTWQGALGVGVEYLSGDFIVSANVAVGSSLPRTVGWVHTWLGPQFTGLLGVAWSLPRNAAVAFTVAVTQRLDATIHGERVAGSGQGLVTLGISGAYPFNRHWRMQWAVLADLPALGRNRPVTVGGTTTLVWAWL